MEYINFETPQHVPSFQSDIIQAASETLIPEGYEDMLTVHNEHNCIVLKFTSMEYEEDEVVIPQKFYNPSAHGVLFPRFLIDVSTSSPTKVDYGAPHLKGCIMNQNQLLWLVLKHRFQVFSFNNTPFLNLLRSDLSAFNDFSTYRQETTPNASLKNENGYAVLYPWTYKSGGRMKGNKLPHIGSPIGESLKPRPVTSRSVQRVSRDLPMQPGSESQGSKGKFVLKSNNNSFYRCTGYSTSMSASPKPGGFPGIYINTIFDDKPNLPARIKSHSISDAFMFNEAEPPIFSEDILTDSKGNRIPNHSYKNCLVVFDKINEATGRLLAGEIEVSRSFANTLVVKRQIIRDCICNLDISIGDLVETKGKKFKIGNNAKGDPIFVEGVEHFEVLDISVEQVLTDYTKITLKTLKKVNSGRIYSNTGLKAVIKPMMNLGYISVVDALGEVQNIDIDMISGPNSTKAGSNTIALAMAGLASSLGYYKSSMDSDGCLSFLDEELVTSLANIIGEVDYTDKNGITRKVLAGVVPVSVNELATNYNRVKLQSFMPEALALLDDAGYSEMSKNIVEDGISEDDLFCIQELQKIISDTSGAYSEEDNVPVLSIESVRELYSTEDLIFNLTPYVEYEGSKILDPDYNNGFYVDLRYRNGGCVRMPSARLINSMVNEVGNGTISYPVILRTMSTFIGHILDDNIGFLNDKNIGNTTSNRFTASDLHVSVAASKLFSGDNLAERLLKPKVCGIGAKQMADQYVPENVMVLMNDKVYQKLGREAGKFYDENGFFRALGVRNPVYWQGQVVGYDVWDRNRFNSYLVETHGFSLYEYISVTNGKDLIYMNPEALVRQQSDVDGDLMPTFVLPRYEDQVALGTFKNKGVSDEEVRWCLDYREGELSSNDKFDILDESGVIKYKVNKVRLQSEGAGRGENSYIKYFGDSIEAKGYVGKSTYNFWTLRALIEIYQKLCEKKAIVDARGTPFVFTKRHKMLILFCYVRAVQDFVIRGIKHNDGGSSGFEPWVLDNMLQPKNCKIIQKLVINDWGIDPEVFKLMYKIVHWGDEESSGYSTYISDFIKSFRKGSIISKRDNVQNELMNKNNILIANNTSMGKPVLPLFEIDKRCLDHFESGVEPKPISTSLYLKGYEQKKKETRAAGGNVKTNRIDLSILMNSALDNSLLAKGGSDDTMLVGDINNNSVDKVRKAIMPSIEDFLTA